VRHVDAHGVAKADRTGPARAASSPPDALRPERGLSACHHKKVHFRSVALELRVFLRGDSNVRWLQEAASRSGTSGHAPTATSPGLRRAVAQLARADGGHIDQIAQVVQQLKTNPDSRRIIVSAWNVAELPKMALLPCHAFFQFYVAPANAPSARARLSCQLYQRSADIFLGVPSTSPATRCSRTCWRSSATWTWATSSGPAAIAHLRQPHEQVALQLSREPRPYPTLSSGAGRLRSSTTPSRFRDQGYDAHPASGSPVGGLITSRAGSSGSSGLGHDRNHARRPR